MDNSSKEESTVDTESEIFETICRFKDTNPSNLSEVFESYGLNTLEAKVPVVEDPIVDKLLHINPEQRMYATMALKSKSATMSVEGRHPRTRNRVLKMVEIDNETVLATGEVRERSPVDIVELDDDLEQYMKERMRLKALKEGDGADFNTADFPSLTETARPLDLQSKTTTNTTKSSRPAVKFEKFVGNQDELDKDLDDYMSEASRKKAQKKTLNDHTSQMEIMMEMEDYDQDHLDENLAF